MVPFVALETRVDVSDLTADCVHDSSPANPVSVASTIRAEFFQDHPAGFESLRTKAGFRVR
jgi:hypothetical protein